MYFKFCDVKRSLRNVKSLIFFSLISSLVITFAKRLKSVLKKYLDEQALNLSGSDWNRSRYGLNQFFVIKFSILNSSEAKT